MDTASLDVDAVAHAVRRLLRARTTTLLLLLLLLLGVSVTVLLRIGDGELPAEDDVRRAALVRVRRVI